MKHLIFRILNIYKVIVNLIYCGYNLIYKPSYGYAIESIYLI